MDIVFPGRQHASKKKKGSQNSEMKQIEIFSQRFPSLLIGVHCVCLSFLTLEVWCIPGCVCQIFLLPNDVLVLK